MATYDAFSFIQVTFLLFILLGVAASELRLEPARKAVVAASQRGAARAVRRRDPSTRGARWARRSDHARQAVQMRVYSCTTEALAARRRSPPSAQVLEQRDADGAVRARRRRAPLPLGLQALRVEGVAKSPGTPRAVAQDPVVKVFEQLSGRVQRSGAGRADPGRALRSLEASWRRVAFQPVVGARATTLQIRQGTAATSR